MPNNTVGSEVAEAEAQWVTATVAEQKVVGHPTRRRVVLLESPRQRQGRLADPVAGFIGGDDHSADLRADGSVRARVSLGILVRSEPVLARYLELELRIHCCASVALVGGLAVGREGRTLER